nr:4-hydroxythreonine-4-phosphate dehydrogenase PdxA [uncultured Gellertiella sp.]
MLDRTLHRPVGLTQGDPAGIGPDITLVAWARRRELHLKPFLFIGDPAVLRDRAREIGLECPLQETGAEGAVSAFADALPVLPVSAGGAVRAGHPHPATASGTTGAIDTAVSLCLAGSISAVVTNPIAKSVLYQAGFRYPGHTEYLAALAEKATGKPVTPVMMLSGPLLNAIPVTIHIPLKDVPGRLTEQRIIDTCTIAHHDLKTRFGIEAPRLAVAGLNPHAGEDGAMGSEEIDVIHPAIRRLRADGIDAIGPLPADTMFHAEARRRYDVAICMYHDQALIPAKALGFDDTVNVTLGLPFVRTSPDHGTAFGIAGQGIAREDSLVAALRLATRLAANTHPADA